MHHRPIAADVKHFLKIGLSTHYLSVFDSPYVKDKMLNIHVVARVNTHQRKQEGKIPLTRLPSQSCLG